MYRNEAGKIVALEDRCSHRDYPLSKGRLIGDTLECGYHGLQFDCAGNCVKVPGHSGVPTGGRIKSYPILERWGWVWIWMGSPALADESQIANFHWLHDPAWGE